MNTANRGYPLLGGTQADQIDTDLAAVRDSIIAIDTDIQQALDDSAAALAASSPELTLLSQSSFTSGPATQFMVMNFTQFNPQPNDVFYGIFEDIVLVGTTNASQGLGIYTGGTPAGNQNYAYRSSFFAGEPSQYVVHAGNSASYTWNFSANASIKHIRKLAVTLRIKADGGFGYWDGLAESEVVPNDVYNFSGHGHVGFGAGNLGANKPSQISFYCAPAGANGLQSCASARLYKYSADAAKRLTVV